MAHKINRYPYKRKNNWNEDNDQWIKTSFETKYFIVQYLFSTEIGIKAKNFVVHGIF